MFVCGVNCSADLQVGIPLLDAVLTCSPLVTSHSPLFFVVIPPVLSAVAKGTQRAAVAMAVRDLLLPL